MTSQRILHVTECWSTGVARAIMGIVAVSPGNEHHLLWAGFETPPNDMFLSTTRLPEGHGKRIRAVRQLVDRITPDVVHLHSSWAGVYGRIRRLKSQVVYQPHCFAFEDLSRPVVQRHFVRLVERILGRNTDAIAAVSERECALGLQMAPKARVVFVPNYSALEHLPVAPVTFTGRNSVVMSGEVREQKDPRMFAAIAKAASGMGLNFVWVGDGSPELRRHLESRGVEVTGWVDKQQVSAFLDRSCLYLHTARYEGFPLSVLDAAARCVPILVRRSPAFNGTGMTMFSRVGDALDMINSHRTGVIDLGKSTAAVRALFNPAVVGPAVSELYGGPR